MNKKLFEVLMWQGSRMTMQEFIDFLQRFVDANPETANMKTDEVYFPGELLTPPAPTLTPEMRRQIAKENFADALSKHLLGLGKEDGE